MTVVFEVVVIKKNNKNDKLKEVSRTPNLSRDLNPEMFDQILIFLNKF
jgi:hypothetical protein